MHPPLFTLPLAGNIFLTIATGHLHLFLSLWQKNAIFNFQQRFIVFTYDISKHFILFLSFHAFKL